ncbi:hypothetical protein OFY17_09780 [Marinomonas sp. C2222]|uniref:Nuclear transport factor 2 family protein n=1 Tax=Marinomonas sargassi TaxID=2984494 RepID=A0ABT2YTH3_9GAMM|nr:hypothetical protein [Marinomonas sargassi]MCV2403166.1 hypothetical protein [Marinomonas sargassi]
MPPEVKIITEIFLKEMLEADDTKNFLLYTKRYEAKYLEGFTQERFSDDIDQMQMRNGKNKSYEFLATLRSAEIEGAEVFRSVWKGVYEKRDAVIEMAIYQKNGSWHLIQSSVH